MAVVQTPPEQPGESSVPRVLAVASPRANKRLPRISPWRHSTQKGGAVLWYLRKHTPMQAQPSNDAEEEEEQTQASTHGASSQVGILHDVPAHVATAQHGATLHNVVGGKQHAFGTSPLRPQQEFLHRTLAAIGAELDEVDAQPRGLGTQPISALQRQQLRQLYVKHVDTKQEQLQMAVTAREKEVAALKMQVQQLERKLVAIRSMPDDDANMTRQVASPNDRNQTLGHKKHRRQRRLSGSAAGEPSDQETTHSRYNSRIDGDKIYTNDLEASLTLQTEEERTVKAELDAKMQRLRSQTTQRKSAEVTLFSLHAQVLRSRTEALRLEGRVSRLADEHRSVYKRMPQAIDQQLHQIPTEVRADHKTQKLVAITAEHWPELLKLKDLETLAKETKTLEKQISLLEAQRTKALEGLAAGHDPDEASDDHLKRMKEALTSMQRSWGVWTEVLLDVSSQKSNPARDGMNQAAVKLTDLGELMALTRETEEVDMPATATEKH